MALSSATQHTMPPLFGRKCGTECLNTAVSGIQREADLFDLFLFSDKIVSNVTEDLLSSKIINNARNSNKLFTTYTLLFI